jgi:hypothetical protein
VGYKARHCLRETKTKAKITGKRLTTVKFVRVQNWARKEWIYTPALTWKGHGPGPSALADTYWVLRKEMNKPVGEQ